MATILIVDDQPANRQFLATLLGYAGHQVIEAANGVEGLERVHEDAPHLVITDILMPVMDGYQFLLALRADSDSDCAAMPVIFISATFIESDARELARACGVAHFLAKPVEPKAVLMAVDAALQMRVTPSAGKGNLDPEVVGTHMRLMANKLHEKVIELEAMNKSLDRRVAERASELEAVNKALEEEIARRKAAEASLQQANLWLREQALRDPLTGLHNRRYLDEAVEREVRRAARHGKTIGLMIIDLDRFKAINDTYGHAGGDLTLKIVSAYMQSVLRGEDIIGRFGGEEFLALLPETPAWVLPTRAEILRSGVSRLPIEHEGRSISPVTVSIGVATYPGDGADRAAVLSAADAALYKAKASGRNRVVAAGNTGA